MRRGCPVPFPSDVLTSVSDSFGVRIAPQKEDVLELARKGVLVDILNDGEKRFRCLFVNSHRVRVVSRQVA